MAKKLCIIGATKEATVPDRTQENIGRPIKKLCDDCHGDRLKGDLARILGRGQG